MMILISKSNTFYILYQGVQCAVKNSTMESRECSYRGSFTKTEKCKKEKLSYKNTVTHI